LDGQDFINRYFDLSSEEGLLNNLPVSYKWMDQGIGNSGRDGSFYEGWDGINFCLARVVQGDFKFFESYRDEKIETMTPKRRVELDIIDSKLPQLRKQYGTATTD
jgi:hypothetical protein